MSRASSLQALGEVTAQQWGMITSAQARAAGVSRLDVHRLIADGIMEKASGADRVYRLSGSPGDPDRDPVRAVWLQLGGTTDARERLRSPDAVVAGRSAALILELGDLPADRHEFYVTGRRQLRRGDVRLRVRRPLPPSQWTVREGLPVCTPARVVDDLLQNLEDGEAVARICRDALDLGLATPAELIDVMAAHRVAYGATSSGALADLLLGSSQ